MRPGRTAEVSFRPEPQNGRTTCLTSLCPLRRALFCDLYEDLMQGSLVRLLAAVRYSIGWGLEYGKGGSPVRGPPFSIRSRGILVCFPAGFGMTGITPRMGFRAAVGVRLRLQFFRL